jgi:hypothetical protein
MENPSLSFKTAKIISKVAFLLVVMGFFMPVACDQNGFELAENVAKTGRMFSGVSGIAIAIYVLFVSALLGGLLLIPLLMKKEVPIAFDWIIFIVSSISGIYVFARMKESFQGYGQMTQGQTLQIGGWFIIIGLIVSLIAIIVGSIPVMKELNTTENFVPPYTTKQFLRQKIEIKKRCEKCGLNVDENIFRCPNCGNKTFT